MLAGSNENLWQDIAGLIGGYLMGRRGMDGGCDASGWYGVVWCGVVWCGMV